jgi:hypothetical protein
MQRCIGAPGTSQTSQDLVGPLSKGVAFGVELVDLTLAVRHLHHGQMLSAHAVLGVPEATVGGM